MKKFKKTLGIKITIPLIISAFIFILSTVVINNMIFNKYAEEEINKQISIDVDNIQNVIKRVTRKAMWTSATCSEMSVVKKAYKTYYKTGDLQSSSQMIEGELKPIIKNIKEYTKQKPNITFHLPPAKVFLRSWTPKRGDDISSFRKTVLEISKTHKPIKGIEIGKRGLVIRAIAPIFDENKKYLGSVETVNPLTEVLKNAKMTEKEEFAIFMRKDLLTIASQLEETLIKDGIEDVVIGDFVMANKLSGVFLLENIDKKKLEKAQSEIVFFSVDSLKYAAFPIYSFNKKAEAIGIIQYNISEMQSSIRKTTLVNISIGVILIGLIIILITLFIRVFISNPIGKVVEAIRKISNKEINFTIQTNRNDEIGELFNSVNEINNNFNEILGTIINASDAILSAGDQLNFASQKISEQANEQASTSEEIAVSMEQMVATINSNTEKAEYTGKISSKSAKETEKSNKVLQQTIESVSEISKKISIITEIAMQTNMLSLNAAIEASRAGLEGKGFAVIATEIRALSNKTKIASIDITQLSNEGKEISKIAGEKLTKLIPEILKSSELVNSIVSASQEQQNNIENINISIQELTKIINENSISSEEMSVSSEQLSAQAQQLKEIVSVFKIKKLD